MNRVLWAGALAVLVACTSHSKAKPADVEISWPDAAPVGGAVPEDWNAGTADVPAATTTDVQASSEVVE